MCFLIEYRSDTAIWALRNKMLTKKKNVLLTGQNKVPKRFLSFHIIVNNPLRTLCNAGLVLKLKTCISWIKDKGCETGLKIFLSLYTYRNILKASKEFFPPARKW